MQHAIFNYKVIDFEGRPAITIIDEDLGGKSVTNDIQYAIKRIEREKGIDADNYLIVYRDSNGDWDGWNNKEQRFISINAPDENTALRFIKRHTFLRK